MKEIIINNVKTTGFDPDFDNISSIQVEDIAFAEGGFGKIYHCKKINGKKFQNPQVIKIFKENGQGSAEHSFQTISILQEKIIEKKTEYDKISIDFLEYYPAFFGFPQFVFSGSFEGEEVCGYSANNLNHFGLTCFTDVIHNESLRDQYFQLSEKLCYAKAYHLARAFELLKEIAYIHADFKTDNFFVSLNDGRCALIDFDSGAIVQDINDDPFTWGTRQDMLAPEIYSQLSENSYVKVNIYSDMWSVAVANHYLLFCTHPLFFLNEISDNTMEEYNREHSWPDIDTGSQLFNGEDDLYEWYKAEVANFPTDIVDCFKHTVTKGYLNKEYRTSYSQWRMKFEPLIPQEERRMTLSRAIRKKSTPPPPQFFVKEADFPKYMATLIVDLIEKKVFLYEVKDQINKIAQELNKPDLYERIERFMQTYYDIIADGIITNVEKNKLRFQSRFLSIDETSFAKIIDYALKDC